MARELGSDRETLGKDLRQRSCEAKPANAPTGSGESKPASLAGLPALQPKPAKSPIGAPLEGGAKPANAPTGSGEPTAVELADLAAEPHAANGPVAVVEPPAAARGPASQCDPYRETILAKLEAGLSIKRI